VIGRPKGKIDMTTSQDVDRRKKAKESSGTARRQTPLEQKETKRQKWEGKTVQPTALITSVLNRKEV